MQRVALDRIRPCPFQPRKDFSPETLRELADSIKEQGIVQPLIVRERDGHLELIAGERRWRAAQLLGLAEVPVILRQADDRAVLELALIENLQRENLNPIEEAHGYAQLIEQFQLKQEEVAAKVGKSRAVVANALRLLKLPPSIQANVREGRLSVGHAKVILGLASEKHQKLAAERILKEGLNVRQTEALVAHLQAREAGNVPGPGSITPLTRDAHVTTWRTSCASAWAPKSICATPMAKARWRSPSSATPNSNASCRFWGLRSDPPNNSTTLLRWRPFAPLLRLPIYPHA